eukprot:8775588-Pyramimonas_sp.AAC.1
MPQRKPQDSLRDPQQIAQTAQDVLKTTQEASKTASQLFQARPKRAPRAEAGADFSGSPPQ